MSESKVKIKKAGDALKKTGGAVVNTGAQVFDKVRDIKDSINIEDVLAKSMKIPGVKINRAAFLRKELKGKYKDDIIDLAIAKNPAYAGISRSEVEKMAKAAIKYESSKVTLISAAAGIPGGAAMAATIPADMVQYFGFLLRIMQKLAYLYGFEEFEFSEDSFSDDAMNEILVFAGVMLGVKNANAAIKIIADTASKKIARSLAQKALTKGTVYPIVKKVVIALGFKMNKQIFADAVSKTVPVVGAAASGGLTFATFRPSANRLRRKLAELNISDPAFYKMTEEEQDAITSGDIIEVEESEIVIDK